MEGRPVILIRSNIKTRRKNIGLENEYIEDNPDLANFFLSDKEQSQQNEGELDISGPLTITYDNVNEIIIDKENKTFLLGEGVDSTNFTQITNSIPENQDENVPNNNETGEHVSDDINNHEPRNDEIGESIEESLPKEEQYDQPQEVTEIYDQFEMENECDYKFERIVDYRFEKGILLLKSNYFDDDGQITTLEIPFSILKKDVPLELAKFIKNNVVEERRNGRYNSWAKKTITNHTRNICRLYRLHNINIFQNKSRRAINNQKRALRKSKNTRNAMNKSREIFGIRIPINTRQALMFDKENKNTKWSESIVKEMDALER